MLVGLQEPVVPTVVQSVLANSTTAASAASNASRGASTPGGGRSSSRTRGAPTVHPTEGISSGGSGTKDTAGELASLTIMPPLGNARNTNKSEVRDPQLTHAWLLFPHTVIRFSFC